LAAQAVLLTAQTVELHFAVEGSRVDQRVLGGEVDPAAVFAEHSREVVLLRAPQVLLEWHLVVVARLPPVAVGRFLGDAAVTREIDLADDGATRPQDRALDDVAELADVPRPRVAHQLRERLVRDAVDTL